MLDYGMFTVIPDLSWSLPRAMPNTHFVFGGAA